jgi:hypothetical protein
VRGREVVRWGKREIVRTLEMEGVQRCENEDTNITYHEILKKQDKQIVCTKENESKRERWKSQE